MKGDARVPVVLVVDDEPFTLQLMTRQLRALGPVDVHPFGRAPDALAFLASADAVDLVLCDLQMPGMDGVEFVRELVHVRYRGALALVSGEDERVLATAERVARAHGLTVLGTMRKPFTRAQLRTVLDAVPGATPPRPRVAERRLDAGALRRALDERRMVVHYQPKVDLATAALVGAEALVRVRDEHGALVMPDAFIPAAESCGLIDEIATAVLGASVEATRQWRRAGLVLHVAVNVSMANLKSLDFPDVLAALVHRAGLRPADVVLEVTESQLMRNPVVPLDILARLRLKHVGLSIDDFGTGHSSLANLRDIPFTELKVDRTFVHGARRKASLAAIVEASLAMARQLGMRSVAEGVEDAEDWLYLREAGCDLAQGYFIGRPMPADDLHAWHAGWEARRLRLCGNAA